MKIRINAYDSDTRTVPVTFNHDGVTHRRLVNACHDGDGSYDRKATAERVQEVAKGIENKIALGAITTPPKFNPKLKGLLKTG